MTDRVALVDGDIPLSAPIQGQDGAPIHSLSVRMGQVSCLFQCLHPWKLKISDVGLRNSIQGHQHSGNNLGAGRLYIPP